MARPPKYRLPNEIPRTAVFAMDERLWTAVATYHKSVDPQRNAIETFRELLWLGTQAGQSDPAQAVTIAARLLAYRHAQAFCMAEMMSFLKDMRRKVEAQGASADANAMAEAQQLVADFTARTGNGEF